MTGPEIGGMIMFFSFPVMIVGVSFYLFFWLKRMQEEPDPEDIIDPA